MSHSDGRGGSAGLVAVAHDPVTEIFLVDGALERRATGVGVLEWWGEPGLYKVRFRAGVTQLDELVELAAGPAPVRVNLRVPFSTPVPLVGTTTSHEYHQSGAEELSRGTDAVLGSGARIIVMVRDYDPGDDGEDGHVAAGLTLHEAGGSLLYSFSDGRQVRNPGQAPWGGAHLELDPGTYRLRLQLEGGRALEQSVVASPGWCTQVFLARAPEAGSPLPVPDLMGAAVLMTRVGVVFDAASPALRWTEMLRRALERGRPAVPTSGEPLEALRTAIRENPMLGLLAAHVLLGGHAAARALAGLITDELDGAVRDHPDARAVRLALNPDLATPAYPLPPMLRSSWDIVLRASVRHPLLVSVDSLAAQAAAHVVPSGAWMVWHLGDEPAAGAGAASSGEGAAAGHPAPEEMKLFERLEAIVARRCGPEPPQPPSDSDLSREERHLLHMMWLNSGAAQAPAPQPPETRRPTSDGFGGSTREEPVSRDAPGDTLMSFAYEKAGPEPAAPAFLPRQAQPLADMDEMVRALQLPSTVIQGAARGLIRKLSRGLDG